MQLSPFLCGYNNVASKIILYFNDAGIHWLPVSVVSFDFGYIAEMHHPGGEALVCNCIGWLKYEYSLCVYVES